jgi:DNA-binding transcriptional ArsR family regulator
MVSEHDHPVDPDRVATVRSEGLSSREAEEMAGLLTLLADPLRSRILSALLVTDEVCVGDLGVALDANEDAVSYALRLLRTAGLVRRRREGRMGYYRLRDGPSREALQACLEHLRCLTARLPEASTDDDR